MHTTESRAVTVACCSTVAVWFGPALVALLAAGCLWSPGACQAALLASEDFESYTLGPVSGQDGGLGWDGGWTPPGNVVRADVVDTTADPLSFSPLGGAPIAGGVRALEVQLSGSPASQLCGVRALARPIAQTFYVGYLVRYAGSGTWAGGNNTFTLHLGTNSSSTTTLNFGLRGGAANEFVIRYGVGAPVSGASTGGELVNDTTYCLVARVNWDGSAFTSANMWLNPGYSAETDKPNGDASLSGFTSLPVTHIFFREAVLDGNDILHADHITIGTTWSDVVAAPGGNSVPSVTLTNPPDGAAFGWPADLLLAATASDTDGSVTNVAFYAGAVKLADDPTEPYAFHWTSVPPGSHALTAVATDNLGVSSTSAVVNITVTNIPSGGLIAEDSFSYLAVGGGTLGGKSGGTGWAGAWVTNTLGNVANIANATGQELKFTPLGGATIDGSAEAVDVSGTVNQPVAFRQLAGPQTNTLYVAYLMRLISGAWSGTATFSVHLSDSGGNVNTLNFGARGGADFMVRNGTGAPVAGATTGGSLTPNTTYYLVARVSKPAGSATYDRIELWVNPDVVSSNAPHAALDLPSGTGLSTISHLILRAAAMASDNIVRLDELKVGAAWADVIPPWSGTPAIESLTLMYPGTNGPVPGYDPITNNAIINLFQTGTNLAIRANSSPPFDFGSVVFSLTGATTQAATDSAYPWSLSGDVGGSYTGAVFNVGAHTLTATPYDADGGTGNPGLPASLHFTVVNTVISTNHWPTVTLTNPPNAATFTAPATVTLQATASDEDGSVTNVSFFANNGKIGEVTSPPYDFVWTNVAAGAYTLTARATDNEGAVGMSPAVVISVGSTNTGGVVTGELKKWHRVTITWDGPDTSETDANNPFRNYRLNVTFTHPASGKSHLVPGYWAADGDAANTSATSGNKWRVNFAPDEIGTWNYVASFRAGTDVALSSSPTAGSPSHFDGASGSFVIGPTDKTGRDHRGKGRLQYVGKHHLRFAETGEYFLKMGADSPENLLNYTDFDDLPPTANYRKTWAAHAADYDPADAAEYTWKGGQGSNLLGAIKYLSDKGMNAFSFIPFTIGGDDKNVCPHLLKGTNANPGWSSGVYHDRFDVSRMEQWDRIFAYGDKKGLYLHFKTMETENELLMDGGNLGPERILYYRELIARYGYHLALNWNLGEEINDATTAQKQAWSQYFFDTDPYRHHQVIHNGDPHYDLLGTTSHLTGFSLQKGVGSSVFSATLDYLSRSAAAGVPWVVALDEPGGADQGVQPDSVDPMHDSRRAGVIWAHLLAGGAGVETYFGYAVADSGDLSAQNWRRYDMWWNQCRYALEFFKDNAVPFWDMTNRNALLTGLNGTYCLALTGQVYVAYLPTNAVTSLNLTGSPGTYSVRWFDPRHGGPLQTGTVAQVSGGASASLGRPPFTSTNDWVVLVQRVDVTPPTVSIRAPASGETWFANLPLTVSAAVTDDVAVARVELWVDGVLQPPVRNAPPYDFDVAPLVLGSHTLGVVAEDTSSNRATNAVTVTVVAPEPPRLHLVTTGDQWQLEWNAPGFELWHALHVSGPWTNVVPPASSPYAIPTTNAQGYFQLRWSKP